MRQLLQDLRFGARTLAKTPWLTTVAILVLAIGIGANSAMFTLVNALLIRPASPPDRPAGRLTTGFKPGSDRGLTPV